MRTTVAVVIAGGLGGLGGLVYAWLRFTAGEESGALVFLYWLGEPFFYRHWVAAGALFGVGLAALWRSR